MINLNIFKKIYQYIKERFILDKICQNIKQKYILEDKYEGFLAIFTITLLVLSSLVLYNFTDELFELKKIEIVLIIYIIFLGIKFLIYKLMFKKISFTESQYYANSFIPLFLILIELPFILINYPETRMLPQIELPTIIVTLIIFIIFSSFIQHNIFSHRLRQIPILKYYAFFIIEVILVSFYFYFLGLEVFNLHPKILYLIKETIIYSFLVYYFYTYQTTFHKKILKVKSRKKDLPIVPGNLVKISGNIIEEIFIKEEFVYFTFKYNKILKYYKIKTKVDEFLFVDPEISHLNIDRRTLQEGDTITLIGIFYVKSFFKDESIKYIYPLFLKINKGAFSRQLL